MFNLEQKLNTLAAIYVIFLNTNIPDVSIFFQIQVVCLSKMAVFFKILFVKGTFFLLRLKCIELYLIDDIVILNERVYIRFFQVFCDLNFFNK